MRLLKKIIFILIGAVALVASIGLVYINSLKPQYSGVLALKHLKSDVQAYTDDYGVPHIYAKTQEDAYRSLGYLHAQERLWQMELMKRIAPGRLSEILGPDLLKTDQFFNTLGIDEASEQTLQSLDKTKDFYKLSMAYIDGINEFIAYGTTPIEFTLLGLKKSPYELKDMYNIFGYMAFSFAMAQKTDPMLSAIQDKLSLEYLKDLDITSSNIGTLIKTNKPKIDAIEHLSTTIAQITKKLPIPAFIGSNSWVVGPKKTTTGKVLFANDPHIGYAQPSVWYEAHLVTPDYEMYGYHLAGVPFPLLGHNRNYAYGITMFENDDIDFYKETNNPSNPNEYLTPEGFKTYDIRSKIIKIKDKEAVNFEVKTSRHGPIMNAVQDEIVVKTPIAMSWVYTQHKNELLQAVYGISHAKNMEDFKAAVALIHAPGLNIMYGDAKDNIGWWAAGKLYKHKPHVNPKFVLDGASGEDDPVTYLPFEENPMAENPDWHYVYSANNQPDSIAGMLYPGYYLPEDRARRIVNLLAPKNDWNTERFKHMLLDVTSPVAKTIASNMINAIDDKNLMVVEIKALEILKYWKGESDYGSIAPTIYQRFIYRYLENTFKDELGEVLYEQLLKTHLIKRSIAKQFSNTDSKWWDNISTDQLESKSDIVTLSFKEAIASLELQLGKDMNQWQWQKVHTLEHPHALGAVALLRPYFNVGPFEVGGTEEVIDNKAFDFNNEGLYPTTSGPSTRRIIDFSDVENSWSILPTGQSGNPFSMHYANQADMYNKGEFRKMKLNKDEIVKSGTLITISPKD
ncbi:MAG: penicillin acylase family protein [Flavobacteriaceae bacterium]|nr:penicillin acylase family protein [Flavobacteriaceae bacterium]